MKYLINIQSIFILFLFYACSNGNLNDSEKSEKVDPSESFQKIFNIGEKLEKMMGRLFVSKEEDTETSFNEDFETRLKTLYEDFFASQNVNSPFGVSNKIKTYPSFVSKYLFFSSDGININFSIDLSSEDLSSEDYMKSDFYFPKEARSQNPSKRLASFLKRLEETTDLSSSSTKLTIWELIYKLKRRLTSSKGKNSLFPRGIEYRIRDLKIKTEINQAIHIKKAIYPDLQIILDEMKVQFDDSSKEWKSDTKKDFDLVSLSKDTYGIAKVVGVDNEIIKAIESLRNIKDPNLLEARIKDEIIPFFDREVPLFGKSMDASFSQDILRTGQVIFNERNPLHNNLDITLPFDSYSKLHNYNSINDKDQLCDIAEGLLKQFSMASLHFFKIFYSNTLDCLNELKKALDVLPNS